MKKISYLTITLLTLFAFYSCSDDDDDDPTSVERIDSYYYRYMHYPTSVMNNQDTDNLVKFEYKGDDIIKRTGGLLHASSSSGYSYVFTDILYEEISYENNQIRIVSKIDSEDYSVAPNERIITLNNKSQMIKKINNRTNDNIVEATDYIYNSKDILIQSIKNKQYKNFDLTETSDFHYDNNNNLDSIITVVKHLDELVNNTKEVFLDYDNSPNLVKNLIIFEESFYRALSQNNYSKYQMFKYENNNNLILNREDIWNFFYDDSGNIDFSKY